MKLPLKAYERLSGSENHRGWYITDANGTTLGEIRALDPDGTEGGKVAGSLVNSVNTLPKLVEALESDLRIFKALVHDTNPHNDLNRGDSIDYDAACLNVERVEEALTLAREVEI